MVVSCNFIISLAAISHADPVTACNQKCDLAVDPDVACALQSVLTSSLDSSSEDVKAVASQALGGVAIGNLSTYLPFILKQIQSQVRMLWQSVMTPGCQVVGTTSM